MYAGSPAMPLKLKVLPQKGVIACRNQHIECKARFSANTVDRVTRKGTVPAAGMLHRSVVTQCHSPLNGACRVVMVGAAPMRQEQACEVVDQWFRFEGLNKPHSWRIVRGPLF